MNTRHHELDSLRGLAALTVLLSHLLSIIPLYVVSRLQSTPFHILWAGHQAVVLFFILSGFVLSLPYYNYKVLKYSDYLIRRICRIYLPYLVSIFVAILCIRMLSKTPLTGLSDIIDGTWSKTFQIKSVVDHVLFLGNFDTSTFNPVIWSLIHEMRISIIFPLLMFLILRLNWKTNVVIAICCTMLYFILWLLGMNVKIDGASYFTTIHNIAFFMLGALLAKHKDVFGKFDKMSKLVRVAIVVFGLLCYTFKFWFFPHVFYFHFLMIDDWATAIGCSIFIIYSIKSNVVKSFLLLKPVHFIGKISYSIYLFHLIVVLAMFNIFYGKLPVNTIMIMSFIMSFIVASAAYYLIEKPSILLGKKLTNRNNAITISLT